MKIYAYLSILGLAFCFGLLAGTARAAAPPTPTVTPTVTPSHSSYGQVIGIMMPGTNGAPATCFNVRGTPIPCSSMNPNAPKQKNAKPRPTPCPTPHAATLH